MKKKQLTKRLKDQKRRVSHLEWQLSTPSEVKMAIRWQLAVLDFPEYPGEGQSFRFRELIANGLVEVRRGKLPTAYAESCKQELIECLEIVEATITELHNGPHEG